MTENIIPIKPRGGYRARKPSSARAPKVIAITSGKGGVGKTNVTSNLAIALARMGHKVCIFDADTGLANINVVMGLTPAYTIEHLLQGEKTLDEILLAGPEGVAVIPAASGIAECVSLGPMQRQRLTAALESLEDRFDYILIDTGAGVADSVLYFVQSAQYAVVVISTEPTSLTDAFALLRMLRRRDFERPVHVLVNMALNYANSMEVYKRFEAAVQKYLKFKVHYLGYITEDKAVKTAVSQQRPVVLQQPDALASRCFTTLAAVLGKQFTAVADTHAFSGYWKDLAASTAPAPLVPAADTTPTPPEPGRSADELQTLAARTLALAADPAVDADQLALMLTPLVQLYVDRFQRLPLREPAELAALLARTDYSSVEWEALAPALADVLAQHLPYGDQQIQQIQESDPEHQEEVLQRYRRLGEHLAAEQTMLHEALARLYQAIEELLPKQPKIDDPDTG